MMNGGGSILLAVSLLLASVTSSGGLRCDRTPEGTVSAKSSNDGRFVIEVSGNPTNYVPGEQYTIFLRSNPDYQSQHKFKEFLLVVEPSSKVYIEDNHPSLGSLQLYGDMLTKYSEKCRNGVEQTNSLPKSEIQVLWSAPQAGSGCVAIRAMAMESRDVWFADDENLSKDMCEDVKESEDTQPNILNECCACDEAKYEVTFEGLWSRNTHPKDFPSNNWLTRFSDIIGASHTVKYHFWKNGDIASEGLRQLAENGNTRVLESELKAKSEHIRTIIKARGISYPNITGKTFAVFRVDKRHHLMSLVSMIDPSPDWIVGVSSLELCLMNCSWVESRVLNLYPFDAGTDDGPTYISPDMPVRPGHPIRRIKTNSPNDPRSPFYDPTGQEMKPMARLYLSRQRLYEKKCDSSTDEVDESESTDKSSCEVDEWSEWSPCSATCGKGVKYKQRGYKNKISKYHCNRVLTKRAPCFAYQKHCRNQPYNPSSDPHCTLTDWGEWSSCSVTCGNGWKTRSRRYKNRDAAKRCPAGRENSPLLEQNLGCSMPHCSSPPEELDLACIERPWTNWSPCSSTCGKGMKRRRKLPLKVMQVGYLRSSSYVFTDGDDEDAEDESEHDEDPCVDVEETVECVNDDKPQCDENENEETALACSLPKDEGGCKSNVDRWYFDVIKGSCDIFSYSGCQGNKNNFKTLERCERVCNEYKKELIANRTAHKRQLGVTVSGVLAYNMQLQNDDAARENCVTEKFHGIETQSQTLEKQVSSEVVDCKLSPWSTWTPCNVTCGKGYKIRHRVIKVHPANGGKKCPEKLLKKRRCGRPCNEDIDCEMSPWSAWSPCSRSCGRDAVQQRTRSILVQPSGEGIPCLPRTETRHCALLACPE